MYKKSFKVKIILPTVAVLIALVVILNVFLSLRFSAMGDYLVNDKLISNRNSLKLYLDDSIANSKMAALSMATKPEVIKAIKRRDTSELLRLFTLTQDLYRVNYFAITDNRGVVLARTNAPELFGDSLLILKVVRNALEGKVSSYFESGSIVKVAVRTGVPVYDTDGSLIGVISAGVRFDTDDAVRKLKNLFNSEITVFRGNIRIASTITVDGYSITGTTMDPHIVDTVFNQKHEYLGEAHVMGVKYKTFYMPLENAQNEVFAAIFIGIPVDNLMAAANQSIKEGILLGLSGLVISITLLFFIISSISKPITKLSNDMNQIANGNLHISIDIKSKDEVGLLSESLQKVADIIHKLLEAINFMISEHERGNIDYCLDTGEFLGDYRKLAESVVELSAFGMMDQLTGIPNRRSFDNRLEMEWNRAIREVKPISILMLDVDKFKNYNDAFGHQQGDMALVTVAKTIRLSIKRVIDFAARFGGEEFVVLLPATDSEGAVCVAEKIREQIQNTAIPSADPKASKLTVSIGVCTQNPVHGSPTSGFVAAADSALYRAKEAGRNRVMASDGAGAG